MEESDRVREIVKEEIVKARLTQSLITFPIKLPSKDEPKFSQEYSQYMIQTPFDKQSCNSCMHYIRGDVQLSTCQIVIESPLPIVMNGWCRLWRDNYELEGIGVVRGEDVKVRPETAEFVDTTVKEVTTIEQ